MRSGLAAQTSLLILGHGGLGATGNTLHGMAGEPHRTRYNTLQLTSTGPLHCCFWCAGSGSGATAIQLGEVHTACVVEPQVHTACVVEPQVP